MTESVPRNSIMVLFMRTILLEPAAFPLRLVLEYCIQRKLVKILGKNMSVCLRLIPLQREFLEKLSKNILDSFHTVIFT